MKYTYDYTEGVIYDSPLPGKKRRKRKPGQIYFGDWEHYRIFYHDPDAFKRDVRAQHVAAKSIRKGVNHFVV